MKAPMRLVQDPITRRFQVHFGGQPIAVTNRYGDIEIGWSSRSEAAEFLATCRDGGFAVSKQGIVEVNPAARRRDEQIPDLADRPPSITEQLFAMGKSPSAYKRESV